MDHLLDLAYKYCDRYEKELDDMYKKIEKAPTISPSDVEIADALWHSVKSILTTKAMIESDDRSRGYTGASVRLPHIPNVGYTGESNPDGYTSRGRDSMGRYTRDSEKTALLDMLEDRMRNVRTEDEAMAIREAMDAINRLR